MYKHNKSKTAFRGRIMSLGLSDKPEKWLGKHYDFGFEFLKALYKPSTTNDSYWYLTCPGGHHVQPRKGFRCTSASSSQHCPKPTVNCVHGGGERTGDLEEGGGEPVPSVG